MSEDHPIRGKNFIMGKEEFGWKGSRGKGYKGKKEDRLVLFASQKLLDSRTSKKKTSKKDFMLFRVRLILISKTLL